MATATQKIDTATLDKLEKMMELQRRAATEGEAQAAAAAITRILAKFNLDAAEAMRLSAERGEDVIPENYIRHDYNLPKTTGWDWMRALNGAIARENFCRGLSVHNTETVVLIGEEQTVMMVKQLVLATIKTMHDQANAEYKRRDKAGDIEPVYARNPKTRQWEWMPQGRFRWVNSYLLGAVDGIREAMAEARQAQIDATRNGTELVAVKDQALRDAVRKYVHATVRATPDGSSGTGYAAGKAYGRAFQVGAKAIA